MAGLARPYYFFFSNVVSSPDSLSPYNSTFGISFDLDHSLANDVVFSVMDVIQE